MKKQTNKLLGAGALSFAAMSACMSASAVEIAATQFSCPPDVGLTECYAGSVVGNGADTTFSDLESVRSRWLVPWRTCSASSIPGRSSSLR